MEILIEDIKSNTVKGHQSATEPVREYAEILKRFSLEYEDNDYTLMVGELSKQQGWILHITVIPDQLEQLLTDIIPELIYHKMAFSIVKNLDIHNALNDGAYGQQKIGKVITVYLQDETIIEPMVTTLMALTEKYLGPQVFTDFKLSNILYTRYGSFITHYETDALGNRIRVINHDDGSLIIDNYSTPPLIPSGVNNPFVSFIKPPAKKRGKLFLIKNTYMPVKLLKSDAKGDVWKALYFKYGIIPKWCVIKQGRKGMFVDKHGRDIQERLAWQYKISQKLKGKISAPLIWDYVQEEHGSFIVMDYVRGGRNLNQVVFDLMKNNAWFAQPVKVKTKILDILINITHEIDILHENNCVHRDITATNFLITKKGNVKVIDTELLYSVSPNEPAPPFRIGTIGYMSPEQEKNNLPSFSDDSYSLGILIMMCLTCGFDPMKLLEPDRARLKNKLNFLIGDERYVLLIIKCISENPRDRPTVDEIKSSLKYYRKEIFTPQLAEYDGYNLSKQDIANIINESITRLSTELYTCNNLWFSSVDNQYDWDVYPLINKTVYPGFSKGLAGVIWLLTKAKDLGFDISSCNDLIENSFKFIQTSVLDRKEQIAHSLHYGKAGIAITLGRMIESGLLSKTSENINIVKDLLKEPAPILDIVYGVSGQGLSVLACQNLLTKTDNNLILNSYLKIILEAQQRDGSWLRDARKGDKFEKVTGFGYGIAGIIYFLIEYYKYCQNPDVLKAVKSGLNYLTNQAISKNGETNWYNSNIHKGKSNWLLVGGPGIAWVFLKGYEITKHNKYLEVGEDYLGKLPTNFIYHNLSYSYGLSGLGHIYIDAYEITNNIKWKLRSEWITDLLLSLQIKNHDRLNYWLPESEEFPTADLMEGNGSVLNYLLMI